MVPDDDQAMALPWASVMVIMVLLNEAFTCATPEAIFLRSRHPTLHRDVDLGHDVLGILLADAMDVLERDDDALVGRNIHACNSGHDFTPVPAGVGARDRVCQFRVPGRALQAIKRRPPRDFG